MGSGISAIVGVARLAELLRSLFPEESATKAWTSGKCVGLSIVDPRQAGLGCLAGVTETSMGLR
jgi:hypothetical protein